MTSIEDTREALAELKAALRVDRSVCRDDPVWLRLAGIEIDLEALDATRMTARESAADRMIELGTPELDRRLAALASDLLAFYALPLPQRGDNEPPLAGHRLRELHGELLRRGLPDETERVRLRDELASFLERRGSSHD